MRLLSSIVRNYLGDVAHGRPCRAACAPLMFAAVTAMCGCHEPGDITMDHSGQQVRFHIDHRGWPRPFWWPRVTEFAIASEEDGAVWQLRSANARGEPARELAIVYGQLPPGFIQESPLNSARPKALTSGRTYFVAAGGPTNVYRLAFALPIDALELSQPRSPTTARSSGQ